jgi:hypothetical protein
MNFEPSTTKSTGTETIATPNLHLNDDQFAECLMGAELSPIASAHLSSCPRCSEELSRFCLSVGDFNSATMAWSDARTSERLPAGPVSAGRISLVHRPYFAAASGALATCLMLAAGVTFVHHQRSESGPTVASVGSERIRNPDIQDSQAQIEQDNKFLTDVYRATQTYDRSPVQEYRLQRADGSSARRRGASRIQ